MIWEREDGSCFVKRGSKFEVEHFHIVWNNGEDEEYGALLFLSLVVEVWGLEGGQRFVKSMVKNFGHYYKLWPKSLYIPPNFHYIAKKPLEWFRSQV
jgi:hypothetical protein